MKRKARIAVFASGTGSNFLAIVKAVKSGLIKAEIAFLLCDNPGAPVIEKAARAGIRSLIVSCGDFPSRESFEAEVLYALRRGRVDLVVLAGFMRILSPSFVRRYRNRIINIHPSLLPSFKGARAIRDAFEYGAKVTGVTVHFVDEKTDHGPIIMQEEVKVGRNDTLAGLEKKIHKIEHRIYPLAIGLFLRGRLRVKGRKIFY
ncbi:MAG: phosphoribosylglycinamide formyltransferase [Candidatus Omnitrophica bacterium]|nr:phosphoribosylglycinamide formyltransferase [Candidatus Omnitrophota bacterium]